MIPNDGEEDVSCEFVTPVRKDQSCEMLRRVLFWESSRVLSFVPDRDGYASYGRPQSYWVNEDVRTIAVATTMSSGKLRLFEQ